jgi:glycosyltransferase involved in cell wall biosynthesis
VVRGVERAVGAAAGRYVWPRARRVVSYNPMVAAHLRRRGVPPERIVHSTIGVDTRVYAPGPADGVRAELGLPDGPLVLFVGRMVDKKGYRHVFPAVGAGCHVVLVGPGRPAVQPPPGATLLGPLPRHTLARLYRAAAVFVLPSTGEVFPIAAQEALASGVPVVLGDSPRYASYPVDRSLVRLVPPEQTADAVAEILGDDDLRRRMGAYARRFAETHFDAAAGAATHLDLYADETEGAPCSSPSSS